MYVWVAGVCILGFVKHVGECLPLMSNPGDHKLQSYLA